MRKWLSPLIFASCLLGTGIGAAEAAKNCNCKCNGAGAGPRVHNVDAITTAPLHVRTGPGKHYKARDVLPPDFPLVVGNCTKSWCQVYYSGRSGWSALPYLAFKKANKHYKDPKLRAFGGAGAAGAMSMAGPRKGHHGGHHGKHHRGYKVSYRGGRGHSGQAGWWNNYQRPSYHRAWKSRWWQKK